MSGSDLTPTLAGFTAWVYSDMQIPVSALPADSKYLSWAFDLAIGMVNTALQCNPLVYQMAVYNLGGDNLINFAIDPPGQAQVFSEYRKTYGIGKFAAGVVASSGDNGTSSALVVPDGLRDLTLQNLMNLKTPWGRQYLAFAQAFGPTVWGMS